MTQEVRLQKLSPSMSEGTIVAWLKGEGDAVAEGEALFQLETDKAVVEFESPCGGVLVRILEENGAKVPVGAVVALIE